MQKGRLSEVIAASRQGLAVALVFSLAINLLILTAPLYMLHVFDSVLSSRSVDTLLWLSLIAVLALLTLAVLDGFRGRLLLRLGTWFEKVLCGPVLRAQIRGALDTSSAPSTQGLRDLATIRTFMGGPGVGPLIDAPWVPLFLLIIFLLHPTLGWVAVFGAIGLFALALLNERSTRGPLAAAGGRAGKALWFADAAVRNADSIEAMGMAGTIVERWHGQKNSSALRYLSLASSRSGTIGAASKFLRLLVQIAVMGTGAWLFIQGELTPGGMIAGSILMARALAPVEQSINGWRQFIDARSAYACIKDILARRGPEEKVTPLPRPEGHLSAEGLTYFHPGQQKPALRAVNFELAPGEALGLIGPTAAGKSTLARLLVGSLKPSFGYARLDGMDVTEWSSDDRGQYVGYVPQDVELFPGTVRDNIARMSSGEEKAVFEAARLALAHDMIMRLPKGYDTKLGDAGAGLSGGQKQSIALARAVYGAPSFVLLDEPTANLDSEGEAALQSALGHLKEKGVTVILIAHRPSLLRRVDKILVLKNGQITEFGNRDEVLKRVTGPTPVGTRKVKEA